MKTTNAADETLSGNNNHSNPTTKKAKRKAKRDELVREVDALHEKFMDAMCCDRTAPLEDLLKLRKKFIDFDARTREDADKEEIFNRSHMEAACDRVVKELGWRLGRSVRESLVTYFKTNPVPAELTTVVEAMAIVWDPESL